VNLDGKISSILIFFVKQNATLEKINPTLFSILVTIKNNTEDKLLHSQLILLGVDIVNFVSSYTGVLF